MDITPQALLRYGPQPPPPREILWLFRHVPPPAPPPVPQPLTLQRNGGGYLTVTGPLDYPDTWALVPKT